MDENVQFKDFLKQLSKQYKGAKVRWLRMLLYDILPIGDLDQSATGLFDTLARQQFISQTDVRLLLEIAEITNLESAIDCIEKYKKTIQGSDTTETVGLITEYRRALFIALKNVSKKDLASVIGFYQLSAFNYNNIWDAVHHIENDGYLDSQQHIEMFAKTLNKISQHILLATPYKPMVIQTPTSTLKPTTAQLLAPTSEPILASAPTGLTDSQLLMLKKTVAIWFDSNCSIRMIKVLYEDLVPDKSKLQKASSMMELLDLLYTHQGLNRNNPNLIYDTITVTKQDDVWDRIYRIEELEILSPSEEVSAFSEYRQMVMRLGNNMSPNDTKMISKMYEETFFKPYEDSWSLIMDLERNTILSEDRMMEFIRMLRERKLNHVIESVDTNKRTKQKHKFKEPKIKPSNWKLLGLAPVFVFIAVVFAYTLVSEGTEKRKHYIHNEHWISSSCKKHITICTALAIGILIIAIPNIFSYPSHYFESQVLDHKRKGTESTTKYSEITESKKESKTKFQTMNADLSRYYEGKRYYWLRFCLMDYLSVSDTTDSIGNDLFNALELKGLITPTNVNLLLEITKLTEVKSAENLIREYMKDNKLQNDDDTTLSDDRKRLFKAMRQVDTDALKRLVAYYNLKHLNLENIWNVVFKLEIVLAKDPYRMKKIHDNLVGN